MAPAQGRRVTMSYWIVAGGLAFIGVIGIVALSLGFGTRVSTEPDTIERRGPFEIVTRHRSDDFYSIRYQGKPFTFEGKAGMYGDSAQLYEWMNSVITFDDDSPVMLVNVGDPINSGYFYLVREVDGRAEASYVGPSRGGVSADWLDRGADEPAEDGTRNITLHRGSLRGGRWLLLTDATVFDTRTFTAYALPETAGIYYQTFARPLGLSPDERSFIRLANQDNDQSVLAVIDFIDGSVSVLPIDRTRMRYRSWEEIDPAWVAHHFEWRRDAEGRDRLTERPDFQPLPYHGRLTRDRNDGYREYRLPQSTRALYLALVDFIVREFHGVQAPTGESAEPPENYEVTIDGRVVNVSFYSGEPNVWMSRGEDSRLVAEIAAKFDQLLASGKFDREFAPPDSTQP